MTVDLKIAKALIRVSVLEQEDAEDDCYQPFKSFRSHEERCVIAWAESGLPKSFLGLIKLLNGSCGPSIEVLEWAEKVIALEKKNTPKWTLRENNGGQERFSVCDSLGTEFFFSTREEAERACRDLNEGKIISAPND
jgi:hypothetical protein